jgi:ABC-2 type transport system ATP-binding protein
MERIFQECVLEVKAEGKSVLLSSHILSEVEKLCDKIAIIRQGKIIETGTLSEMRHLTRTKLTIKTKETIPALQEMKGIHNLEQSDSEFVFQVDTEELGNIIQYISTFGIEKLESVPPSLEDLFLRYLALL